MKVLIILAICASCASASRMSYGGSSYAGSTDTSSQFRSEDNYGNYQFGYDETHATGSTARREERSGDVVRGSYHLGDADGRSRTVNYVADAAGFRASVHTNEPGVDAARDPADVLINEDDRAVGAYAAPAPVYSSPAQRANYAYSAPAYSAPAQTAPVKSYAVRASVYSTPSYSAPSHSASSSSALSYGSSSYSSPAYAPAYGAAAPAYEAPTPRAFSYSFSTSHPSYAAPAPIYSAPLAQSFSAPAPTYGRQY